MMTEKGVSTTTERGTEQYEKCRVAGSECFQYDYRHVDGRLFSCVRKTLEKCREERDKWLEKGGK